ncbi:MAG TPA: sialate O-acetylesterase [Tepidisphaeraceae bacterium]|jgi:sialate O-acetylesterase
MNRNRVGQVVASLFLLLSSPISFAKIELPPLFADHMVLQRDREVPIWGKASPNEKITIEFAGQTASATADAQGKWIAKLPAMKKVDGTTLTITGADNQSITLKDVLVGDVWICSGQSNMEWPVNASANATREIADANHPNIRLFNFPKTVSMDPSKEVKGEWKVCSPQTVPGFSAVGYFFGREINRLENVPVGLIANPWGGMPAEAFTSREALEADPDLKPLVDVKENARAGAPEKKKQYEQALAAWQENNFAKDPGNEGAKNGWAKPEFDDSKWKEMDEPTKWEKKGLAIDGGVWFRKTVDIPADWGGKALTVSLGIIDDFDTTYVDGHQVGAVGPENIFAWATQRKYTISGENNKTGKMVIATRIFDRMGDGGFNGPESELYVEVKESGGKQRISLAGPWKYQVEFSRPQPAKQDPPPAAPFAPDAPNAASNLFNGMVNPVIPYGIRGAIWYQGESNADRAEQYRKLFPAMIADWRKQWGQGEFPFLFVQLANFGLWKPRPTEPADSTWAELREAQTMTLSKSPNTGMAVTIDIGETADIHPKNKQDVGKRLALAAEKLAYGKNDIEYAGPMYESMKTDGSQIRIQFTHADGMNFKGGSSKGFQIAGADKKWHWADARIQGNEVIVSAKAVEQPVAVRYGWGDDPEVSLYNAAGLPASPFRTDDWPMVTAGVQVPGQKPKK